MSLGLKCSTLSRSYRKPLPTWTRCRPIISTSSTPNHTRNYNGYTLAPLLTNAVAICKGSLDSITYSSFIRQRTALPTPRVPPVTNTTFPETSKRRDEWKDDIVEELQEHGNSVRYLIAQRSVIMAGPYCTEGRPALSETSARPISA